MSALKMKSPETGTVETTDSNKPTVKADERTVITKKLTAILPGLKDYFGKGHSLVRLIEEAIGTSDIDELRIAEGAVVPLPEHVIECLLTGWEPEWERPSFRDLLIDLTRAEIKRFFRIFIELQPDGYDFRSNVAFELSVSSAPFYLRIEEGTSKDEALEWLDEARQELESSWEEYVRPFSSEHLTF